MKDMRKLMTMAIVLIASATMVFAASVDDMYSQFADALASGDASKAIDIYDNLQERAQKDYLNAERSYEKALDAGNFGKARQVMRDLQAMKASPYTMTEEDTDNLLSLILKIEDEDQKKEMAQWLYANSPYYSPTVTYDWSTEGDNYSYRFARSVSVAPGNEITFPSSSDIGIDTSLAGVLEGWGVTRSDVMYQPGEVIPAPYTSQTYYAIWKTGVVFSDKLTGEEIVIDGTSAGDVVNVPSLTAPDDSYIFAGWVDKSNGEYIPADETEYTLSGNGASFEALWKKVEIADISASPYDIGSVPLNTQIDLSFTISNPGTENMRNSIVDLTTDSEGVDIQKGHGRVPSLPAGRDIYATGLRVVVTEPGTHDMTLTFTDRDGDTWTQSFQIQAE